MRSPAAKRAGTRSRSTTSGRSTKSCMAIASSAATVCSRGNWWKRACRLSKLATAATTPMPTTSPGTRDCSRRWSKVGRRCLQDLHERGLLENTLVVWMGEIGRTPQINNRAGRDHYVRAWSTALAGCGVKGGLVYGETDKEGRDVTQRQVTEGDFFATVYQALGSIPRPNTTPARPVPIAPFGSNVVQEFSPERSPRSDRGKNNFTRSRRHGNSTACKFFPSSTNPDVKIVSSRTQKKSGSPPCSTPTRSSLFGNCRSTPSRGRCPWPLPVPINVSWQATKTERCCCGICQSNRSPPQTRTPTARTSRASRLRLRRRCWSGTTTAFRASWSRPMVKRWCRSAWIKPSGSGI
jgi:predicted small lipoprotein YifL